MNHIIKQLIDFDIRFDKFKQCLHFLNYEIIEGDILEFGVYTGRSLLLLAYAYQKECENQHKIDFERNVVGFDSFYGVKKSFHPRWDTDNFKYNHSFHPILNDGDFVNDTSIFDFFDAADMKKPQIINGFFKQTLPLFVEDNSIKAALIHIDCDTYDATIEVLMNTESIMTEGTIILFDDWFNYRGGKNKGEQKAFYEFADKSKWDFLHYGFYATFANSFIVIKK